MVMACALSLVRVLCVCSPDMLEVGNGGMSTEEYQAHFSLWCLLKAPLLVGCDVTAMTNATFTILTNAEIIAINQDALGVQANRRYGQNGTEVWAGPLANGDIAVVLFNRVETNTDMDITVRFVEELGLNANTTLAARDLVEHKSLGQFTGHYTVTLPRHTSQTLRLSAVKQANNNAGVRHVAA